MISRIGPPDVGHSSSCRWLCFSCFGGRAVGATGSGSVGRCLPSVADHGGPAAGVALLTQTNSRRDVVPERRQRVLGPVRFPFAYGGREGVPEVARPSSLLLPARLDVDVGGCVRLRFALGCDLQDMGVFMVAVAVAAGCSNMATPPGIRKVFWDLVNVIAAISICAEKFHECHRYFQKSSEDEHGGCTRNFASSCAS